MKIIKQGHIELLEGIKKFECEKCGCIFEANRAEYRSGMQYNIDYYYCRCPTCNTTVYKEVKI